MKIPRLILIFIFAAAFFCGPGASYAYNEGDIYRVTYQCRDLNGNPRWKGVAEIRHKEGDIYTITEKLEGIYYGFKGRISWVAVTELERTRDTVKPLNMDQRIFDASGKLIAIRKQEFDHTGKTVTCTYDDLIRHTSSTEKFTFTRDIINRLLQGLYVQKFLEKKGTKKEIQLISPEPDLYNLELRIVGEEEIELNGQKRKAFKIVFDPQLGLLNFVKVFLPKAYVWHSAEPPYELLKYRGIETSIHAPIVEIDTIESGFVHEVEKK
jgi:hypothetical protein